MKYFKVEVSQGLNKYSFVRKVESENELKETLHNEGYSILFIKEVSNIDVSGNKFYFEVLQDGEMKNGTIMANDIFKAYLKIKYQLKYNLQYIYSDPDESFSGKERIMKSLQDQFRVYVEVNRKKIQKEEKETQEKVRVVPVEESVDNFQMSKEINQVYSIIDQVIEKLKRLIQIEDNNYITFEKREKLQDILNEIMKIKSSTNIVKLRKIGEIALIKIGEIELRILESQKDDASKILLKETNKLLKQVGSKSQFISKDQDIKYIAKNFFSDYFKNIKKKTKKKEIDTTTSVYLTTRLLLEQYEKKLRGVHIESLKNFYKLLPIIGDKGYSEDLAIKKRVLRQNIAIFELRTTNKRFSYSSIRKGYNSFIEKLLSLVYFLKDPLFILVVVYSIVFLITNILNYTGIYESDFNFMGLFYFLFIILTLILLRFVRGFLTLGLSSRVLVFLFIFGVINF